MGYPNVDLGGKVWKSYPASGSAFAKVFVVLLAMLLASPVLGGGWGLSLGPSIVASNGLGYESPYGGVVVLLEAEKSEWRGEATFGLSASHKAGFDEGFGVSAVVDVARAVGDFEFGLGARWSHTTTPIWFKNTLTPRASISWNQSWRHRLTAYYEGKDTVGEIKRVVGAESRYRVGRKWTTKSFLERVGFDQNGKPGSGWVLGVGVLFPLWGSL